MLTELSTLKIYILLADYGYDGQVIERISPDIEALMNYAENERSHKDWVIYKCGATVRDEPKRILAKYGTGLPEYHEWFEC